MYRGIDVTVLQRCYCTNGCSTAGSSRHCPCQRSGNSTDEDIIMGFPIIFFTGMPCTSKCLCQQGMGCKGKYTRRSEERKK